MSDKIPETMQEVDDQVTLMNARGFAVTADDVIKEALKNGFQEIVDDLVDGSYFTVRWDDSFNALQIFGIANAFEGEVKPAEDEADYIAQFKANASRVWTRLDDQASAIIGR